jgi:hypothetical protein
MVIYHPIGHYFGQITGWHVSHGAPIFVGGPRARKVNGHHRTVNGHHVAARVGRGFIVAQALYHVAREGHVITDVKF